MTASSATASSPDHGNSLRDRDYRSSARPLTPSCLTASKLQSEFALLSRPISRAMTAPVAGKREARVPRQNQMGVGSSHASPLFYQDPEIPRCRPRVPKLLVPAVNPVTKERSTKDVTHLQDYTDRLSALRECMRMMFGSVSEIYRKLNCNGNGFVNMSELESGMNELHIPWQQVTGSTHSELASLIGVGKSGSIDILDFLGAKALTPRPDWSALSIQEQWEDYSNRVIELDLTQMAYSPPLWSSSTLETKESSLIESRRKLLRVVQNCCADAQDTHLSRDDLDFIQTKIVKIEKFLKDFNDNKRELVTIKLELANITESQERAAELKKRREDEEREKQRIKTEAGLALVSGEHGKIALFGKAKNVQLSMFREPDEDELRNYFSLTNPTLLTRDEIVFRAKLKSMGISLVQGDKVKKLFSKYNKELHVDQDQFVSVLTELMKISAEIVPLSRFKSYWISASGGKDTISLLEFLSWYSSSGLFV